MNFEMKERCFYCREFQQGLFLDNLLNSHYVFICQDCFKKRSIYIKDFIKSEKKIPNKFNFIKKKF